MNGIGTSFGQLSFWLLAGHWYVCMYVLCICDTYVVCIRMVQKFSNEINTSLYLWIYRSCNDTSSFIISKVLFKQSGENPQFSKWHRFVFELKHASHTDTHNLCVAVCVVVSVFFLDTSECEADRNRCQHAHTELQLVSQHSIFGCFKMNVRRGERAIKSKHIN